MAKVLLLLGVVAVVVLLLKNYRRSLERLEAPPDGGASGAPSAPADMTRCARCGVHVPRAEGILSGGRFFCTEEHRRLGPEKP
ncbi:MAG: hypothetical protein MUF30_04780 [Burkholderiales bacterium]|nr:hypothetical protein [Burkholderiales bacterium]